MPELSFAARSGMYDKSGKLLLKNLTLQELEEWCVSVGA
jgi:23S rRNA (adenine2503-C2)-methyltransferase